MPDFVELVIKIFTILGSLGLFSKLFVTISNKTDVEILFTPNHSRRWDNLIDATFFSVIMIGLFAAITFVIKLPIHIRWVLEIGRNVLPIGVLILWAFLLISKVVISLRHYKPKNNGLLANVIWLNMFLFYFMLFYLTAMLRSLFRNQIMKAEYTLITLYLLVIFALILGSWYAFIALYKFIIRPTPLRYRVEPIAAANINEELKNLYFIFALDSESHVLSRFPTTRAKMKLPAYIHYPKENALYCYYVEKELSQAASSAISSERDYGTGKRRSRQISQAQKAAEPGGTV
ncbi:MAG: hypothetical protein K0R57_5555 [Paenibacillaceae bacterium]|jgi:hypothetical protein|nr:hypothetical protein [Paenibacillaceae bacterium]